MDVTTTDLSPRPPQTRRRRNPAAIALLALVLLGAGFVLVMGLRSATLYYYNADEAVLRRDSLGDDRFRVQGTVQDPVTTEGEIVRFAITFNGASVPVQHRGDPPDLFRVGIPVVLEGRWQGAGEASFFASDRILVKHSSEYREENPDRVPTNTP